MAGKRPLLRDDVEIIVEDNGHIVLFSTLSPDAPRTRMHPTSAQIVAAMDGTRDHSEVLSLMARLTGKDKEECRGILTAIYQRYGGYIVDGRDKPPRRWSEAELTAIAGGDATPPDQPVRRLSGPQVLDWIVTRFCNRRCIYCYNNAQYSSRADDEERLGPERLSEILDEAYAIGIQEVKLLGAEPFLFSGSFNFIAEAVKRDFAVEVITKWHFSPDQAEMLAATGLKRIYISLDSADPDTGDRLVGCRGYVDDSVASIRNLHDAGIEVIIECVVCRPNLEHLPGLAQLARDLGLGGVNVFEYMTSLGRNVSSLELTVEERERVKRIISEHNDVLTQGSIVDPAVERQCNLGINEIAFLPDGRVPLCYQLPLAYRSELHFADLRHQSIMEAWHEWPDAWSSELFAGTACEGCEHYERCHNRGRCISSAAAHCGRPFGPHANCPGSDRAVAAGVEPSGA